MNEGREKHIEGAIAQSTHAAKGKTGDSQSGNGNGGVELKKGDRTRQAQVMKAIKNGGGLTGKSIPESQEQKA